MEDNNQQLLYIKTSSFSYPITPLNATFLIAYLDKLGLSNRITHTEMGDYLDLGSLDKLVANEILTTLNREEDAFNTAMIEDFHNNDLLARFHTMEKEINSYEQQIKFLKTKNPNLAKELHIRITEFHKIMLVKEMIKTEDMGRGR